MAIRPLAAASGLLLVAAAPRIAVAGGAQLDQCLVVAGWDAERDLVAYERRRGDCATPPPALTGSGPNRREKSVFILRRISTGQPIDTADCEISFQLFKGESPCGFAELPKFRKPFRRLRPNKRGTPIDAATPAALIDFGALGLEVLETRRASKGSFVLLVERQTKTGEPTHVETLVQLPDGSTPAKKRLRQRSLVDQVAYLADYGVVDSGRALVRAARAEGPLDPADLFRAFCRGPDVAHRIDAWRAASSSLDDGERKAAETALAARGCFPRVDLASYDATETERNVAMLWLDAMRRKDRERFLELSGYPFRMIARSGFVLGLWPGSNCTGKLTQPAPGGFPAELGSDRKILEVLMVGPGRFSTYELGIPDRAGMAKELDCLFAGKLGDYMIPPLRGGRMPPNRDIVFDGWTVSILPFDRPRLPLLLGTRYHLPVAAAWDKATPVEVSMNDNDGKQVSILMLIDKEGGPGGRVLAAFVEEWAEID